LPVSFGVDLNRNFVYGWGNSGSGVPTHNTEYRGISAGSEPETQAVRYAQQKYDPQIYVNVHCGMEMLSGGGNTTISSKIISLLDQISAVTPNSSTRAEYSPGYSSGCGTGGYVKADACANKASAWLFEISEWGHLPATLAGYYEKWRPNYFPVYLAMAKSIQIDSNLPNNNNTFINTSFNPNSTTNENTSTILIVHGPTPGEWRNYFGIHWTGDPCQNLDYAKAMGYDYIMYMSNMEKCPNIDNMYFYLESPETSTPIAEKYWYLDYDRTYTEAEINTINNYFVWRYNATFPNNIATGWFFSFGNVFRPLPDIQREDILNESIYYALKRIKKIEKPARNFLFAGYSWDVPDFKGDWWTANQKNDNGKIVKLSYWTNGTESAYAHDGIIYDYATYPEAAAELRKRLFAETEKLYPGFKIYYQPYGIYNSWIKLVEGRSDVDKLMPEDRVILCQEDGDSYKSKFHTGLSDFDFVLDQRIFASNLIDVQHMCQDTPDMFNHTQNLGIAGYAAAYGAWTNWYGRYGGTDNMPAYKNIAELPARFKLIRLVANWDNLNQVPLENRHWDAQNLIYESPNSYADVNLIYSTHPKNKNIYFVLLNSSTGMPFLGTDIYSTDALFRPVSSAMADFNLLEGKLYLNSESNLGAGYVIVANLSNYTDPCETCAEYENETVNRTEPEINQTPRINTTSFRKHFPRFDLATNAVNPGRVRDLVLGNQRVKVDWRGRTINITRFNESAVRIGDDFIDIDSDKFPELNQPAYITFIRVLPNYIILHNGEPCHFPTCSLVVYDPIIRTLNFRVSGFSNYSINYTGNYNATYDKQDLKAIVVDGVATFGASFVDNAELFVIALVLLLAASLIARYKK